MDVDLVDKPGELFGKDLVEHKEFVPTHERDILHGPANSGSRELEIFGEWEIKIELFGHPGHDFACTSETSNQVLFGVIIRRKIGEFSPLEFAV